MYADVAKIDDLNMRLRFRSSIILCVMRYLSVMVTL